MELHDHVFYTFAQGASHNVDLGVARSMHVNALSLGPESAAALLNQIAAVCNKKYNALCDTYDQYCKGEIDKAACLYEFKRLTKEVFPNG